MVTARAAALHALVALDRGRSDRLRAVLDEVPLAPRERSLANELAHGVLRRERLLDFVLDGLAHRGLPKDPRLRAALRLGAYQVLFVAGVPAHAAVHETVALVRNNKGFANALLRRLAERVQPRAADPAAPTTELVLRADRSLELPKPLPADDVERLAIVHSLPGSLLQRWRQRFTGDELRQIAEAASAVPGVFLRVSAGRDREALRAALGAAGVACEPVDHPRLLRWVGGSSPFASAAFRGGQFVVQDPTALAAAEAVPCGAGSTVVDLCAAPGTKTTLIAERVRPGGRVFAFDPDPARRARIAENVARLGLEDPVCIVDDFGALPLADAVLADVPCSNTGVLGRRVEVRRRLATTTFTSLAALQRELLARAIELTRPGGAVVYSTCSIDREENEEVVAAVSASLCAVEHTRLTLPLAGAHDGGFVAVLRRRAP
ncbi:MAG TPA: transcription antitermination factor NusB [Planctomycetota bacterium]|nr:transcription antitermination factor NusB [Planctomycetota bacterium]